MSIAFQEDLAGDAVRAEWGLADADARYWRIEYAVNGWPELAIQEAPDGTYHTRIEPTCGFLDEAYDVYVHGDNGRLGTVQRAAGQLCRSMWQIDRAY